MSTIAPDSIESLQEWLAWLHPGVKCKCTYDYKSLGLLHGVSMGKGWLRMSTHPQCPVHSLCQGYTKAVRAARPVWSNPWCPKHKTRDCPDV
jgi:hypothetical protein